MVYDENGVLTQNAKQIAVNMVLAKQVNDSNMRNKASLIKWEHVEPLESDAIKNFEEKFKYKIPSDLKQLITKYNYGTPDRCVFTGAGFKGLVFGGLLSFNKESEYNETVYLFLEKGEEYGFTKNGKIVMLPFGITPSGDVFCMKNGGIVLWNHELEDDVTKLASSLNEFLSKLQLG